MVKTPLGKVAETDGGNFILGTAYTKLTNVYDSTTNASYRAKIDNQNVAVTDTIIWQKTSQGVGTGTGASDNNYTNAAKTKVDALPTDIIGSTNGLALMSNVSTVVNTEILEKANIASGIVGIDADGMINNEEFKKIKQREYNIKDFGAVGDNVNDDTSAFQTAINFATNYLATISIPNGNYKITSTLNITGNGFITLAGSSKNNDSCQLNFTGTGDMINCTALYQITIKNLRIIHNGANGSCVNLSKGEFSTLDNCSFANVLGNATPIVQFYYSGTVINNCGFVNNEPQSSCIYCSRKSDIIHINSYIRGCNFGGAGRGLVVTSEDNANRLEGLNVSDNIFLTTGIFSILIESGFDINITNNMIDQSATYGILLDSKGLLIDGVRISNNYISSPVLNGSVGIFDLSTQGISNVSIINNRFLSCGYGIQFSLKGQNIKICSNSFEHIRHCAISLNSTVCLIVTSNIFYNCEYDIALSDSLPTAINYIIANNAFTGLINNVMTNANIYHFSNNVGFTTDRFSSLTFDASTTGLKTIAIPHGLSVTPELSKCMVSLNGNGTTLKYDRLTISTVDATKITVLCDVTVADTVSPTAVVQAKY